MNDDHPTTPIQRYQRWVGDTTALDREPPRVCKATSNYLRAEQARKLFEVFPSVAPQWNAMLYLLTFTALRWGEASALSWQDLDDDAGVIRVNRAHYKASPPS